MKNKLVVSLLSVVLISGCASIVSDSVYPVAISSTPSNARFVVTNQKGIEVHSGRTPSTISLKSGDGYFSSASYTVTFKKSGFEDKNFVIESRMDGWYWGNILFGGLIGMLVVDPLTGAMWKLPDAQSVSLNESVTSAKSSSELIIVSIDDLPASDRAGLVRIN